MRYFRHSHNQTRQVRAFVFVLDSQATEYLQYEPILTQVKIPVMHLQPLTSQRHVVELIRLHFEDPLAPA